MGTLGMRTLPGGFCRKQFSKRRFRFVATISLLMIVCEFGLNEGKSDQGSGVAEDVGGRETFWKSLSKVHQGSTSLPEKQFDHFHRKIRTRTGVHQNIVNAKSEPIETMRDYTTTGAEGKEFYRPSRSLSEGHRRLANITIETWEETGVPSEVNATATEDEPIVGFSKVIVVLTILLGAIAILLSIASSIFVYWYRNNILVAIGQPPFLHLVCFGSFLLSSELFFLFRYGFARQSVRDATCIAQLWLRNIGSVCVHMAIFCKLWRAYKVAQFRKNQIVLPKHVIGPFVIMIAAVIAVTIAQTIVDPPVWQMRTDPALGYVGMCLPGSMDFRSISGKDLWIEISTQGLQFLSLVLMLLMAYLTRNIPEDLSDSRSVFQAVISNIAFMLVTSLIFWIGVWRKNYGLSAISRSLRYFFDAVIFVGFLVIPKIIGVWREKHSRTTSSDATPIAVTGRGQVHVGGLNSA